MLANDPFIRDADFSHLRLFSENLLEQSESLRAKSNSKYLLGGLLVSLLFHLSLILWRPVAVPEQPASRVINLTLVAAVPETSVEKLEVPAPESVLPGPVIQETSPPEIKESNTLSAAEGLPLDQSASAAIEKTPVAVIPLSTDDLREISTQRIPQDPPRRAGSISENVFNPALRKRLIEEENKPEFQRADGGLRTHTDPSGARVVDREGSCLRSSDDLSAAEQNWYMTSCAGKSESERMMDRVDQAVNGKLRFE